MKTLGPLAWLLVNLVVPSVVTLALVPVAGAKAETGGRRAQKAPRVDSSSSQTLRQAHLRGLMLAHQGDVKGALRSLNLAAKGAKTKSQDQREELDRVSLSIGRLHYENGEFEQAIAAYDDVRKYGSSWLEALEEKAWANLRLGRPHEAIASLKTVTIPLYKDVANAEPYFVLALAQLRICDFPALFKTYDLFKERFRDRVKGWEASSNPADRARIREAAEVIHKMNLVEAEAIQRLYLDDELKKSVSVPSVSRGARQLSFPAVDGEEVWLDEVDDYRVSLKGCAPIGAPQVMVAKKLSAIEKQETSK